MVGVVVVVAAGTVVVGAGASGDGDQSDVEIAVHGAADVVGGDADRRLVRTGHDLARVGIGVDGLVGADVDRCRDVAVGQRRPRA